MVERDARWVPVTGKSIANDKVPARCLKKTVAITRSPQRMALLRLTENEPGGDIKLFFSRHHIDDLDVHSPAVRVSRLLIRFGERLAVVAVRMCDFGERHLTIAVQPGSLCRQCAQF